MGTEAPSPEQAPLPAANTLGLEAGEDGFDRDAEAVEGALQYVNEAAPDWVLDPAEVSVEQPPDQDEILTDLSSELRSQMDGDKLPKLLDGNLQKIRRLQGQTGATGISRLDIRAGFNMADLAAPDPPLTRQEYKMLYQESHSDAELIESVDQPNSMIDGLVEATAAEVLRDGIGADGAVTKTYKGMLDGEPVYFEERIMPRIREGIEPGEKTAVLERSFTTVSEETATHSLNTLSDQDAEVLRSIGVEVPELYSPDYNPSTYPDRSSMLETLQLYSELNPTAANIADSPEVANVQELIDAQSQRAKDGEIAISNFTAHGATEEQIQAFREDVARMESVELRRGKLFPSQSGFKRFEDLSKTDVISGISDLEISSGPDFEQGDFVSVQRSSGAIEHQWTFMGYDTETGEALVGGFDDQNNKLYKRIPIDELKTLKQEAKAQSEKSADAAMSEVDQKRGQNTPASDVFELPEGQDRWREEGPTDPGAEHGAHNSSDADIAVEAVNIANPYERFTDEQLEQIRDNITSSVVDAVREYRSEDVYNSFVNLARVKRERERRYPDMQPDRPRGYSEGIYHETMPDAEVVDSLVSQLSSIDGSTVVVNGMRNQPPESFRVGLDTSLEDKLKLADVNRLFKEVSSRLGELNIPTDNPYSIRTNEDLRRIIDNFKGTIRDRNAKGEDTSDVREKFTLVAAVARQRKLGLNL